MGPGMMSGGTMGRGMMGPGMMGRRHDGRQEGRWTCPLPASAGAVEGTFISAEKAKELAQQYADQYLKGFAVERVLPFSGRRGTMYSVELKGPEGQVRSFRVNPWGNVMPFGGPARRTG
jgi:hypothetical protein